MFVLSESKLRSKWNLEFGRLVQLDSSNSPYPVEVPLYQVTLLKDGTRNQMGLLVFSKLMDVRCHRMTQSC